MAGSVIFKPVFRRTNLKIIRLFCFLYSRFFFCFLCFRFFFCFRLYFFSGCRFHSFTDSCQCALPDLDAANVIIQRFLLIKSILIFKAAHQHFLFPVLLCRFQRTFLAGKIADQFLLRYIFRRIPCLHNIYGHESIHVISIGISLRLFPVIVPAVPVHRPAVFLRVLFIGI